MLKPLRVMALGVALQTPLLLANANSAEAAEPAASSSPTVVQKVGKAVQRGASAAEGGIKRGVGAAESGVKKAASAVGRGASVAAGAIDRTARRIGLPAASAASSP